MSWTSAIRDCTRRALRALIQATAPTSTSSTTTTLKTLTPTLILKTALPRPARRRIERPLRHRILQESGLQAAERRDSGSGTREPRTPCRVALEPGQPRKVVMSEERFEKALAADVSKIFREPADILRAGDLTNEQKIALLRQWDADLRLQRVASEENMTGTAPGRTAELLQAVRQALARLGVEGKEEAQAPNKSGGA